ncbi:hypothetical protein TorRG33x02_230570 [Trema orientale]|uniref:Uncharacterized protein n=1 Tax=Trema orientale TaxID=63057 RepID=A0A2P5E6L1_TREOI|nr:hypothetical protein TorRG33x02_230570 [Trema orientale]
MMKLHVKWTDSNPVAFAAKSHDKYFESVSDCLYTGADSEADGIASSESESDDEDKQQKACESMYNHWIKVVAKNKVLKTKIGQFQKLNEGNKISGVKKENLLQSVQHEFQ